MISGDVQRIHLEAKERSLEEFRFRCQELVAENLKLQEEKETQEHDSQLVLKFLREDAERKDELIESLRKTINQQRELFAAQREDERQAADAELNSVRDQLTTENEKLTRELSDARDELDRLADFKRNKLDIERALEDGENERERMRDDHKLHLEALERKFLEEKNRLQKEYKQMLAEMKKSSQEEAVERLDSSTKKILFENRRMAEELRLQVAETDSLQKTKKVLEEEGKKLRREVALNEQSVKEYAKQGFRQSKEIKELSAKVKGLERSLSQSVHQFEKEKDTLSQTGGRRLAEAELDTQGLRQLVRLKSKELSHMKRLAAIILQKRNEVETFLLDSIDAVKGEITRRRAEEERAMPGGRRGLLPALGSSKPSNLPSNPDEHVDIRDLTWDDRERVLRLLFAKINNAAPFQPMPPHPLNDDPSSMRRAMGILDDEDGEPEGEHTAYPFITQPPTA